MDGKYILVEEAANSAREKSTGDQTLLTRSLEEGELRQVILRIPFRLEALEKS